MKIFKKKIIKVIVAALAILNLNTKVFAATEPDIVGRVAITMDVNTNEVIYSKNAEEPHALASTTKLLTSLLFAENKAKGDTITYSDYSASLTETTLSGFLGGSIKAGDTINADDVMKAVMIFSANDCAVLMAESVGGSIEKFTEMMNEKAKELGAVNSTFINPNGLELEDGSCNITTAYDLALIGAAAYKNQWVKDTMAMDNASVSLKGYPIYIETRNKNLGKNGNVGGKTGTETRAGHCFVGFYNKDGRELVTVVLGSNYGSDGTIVFDDTDKIADYSYKEEKEVYYENDEKIMDIELTYKLFRFFGPEKKITAPVYVNSEIMEYKNTFNDDNLKITVDESYDLSGWKIASNNNVKLNVSSGIYNNEYDGRIELKTQDIINANLPLYTVCGILAAFVLILLIIIIVKISGKVSHKRK